MGWVQLSSILFDLKENSYHKPRWRCEVEGVRGRYVSQQFQLCSRQFLGDFRCLWGQSLQSPWVKTYNISLVLLKIGNYTCHDIQAGDWSAGPAFPAWKDIKIHVIDTQSTSFKCVQHYDFLSLSSCRRVAHCANKTRKGDSLFIARSLQGSLLHQRNSFEVGNNVSKNCPSNTRMQSSIIPTRENHQTPACGHRKVLGTVGLASFTLCLPQTRNSETNFIGTLMF